MVLMRVWLEPQISAVGKISLDGTRAMAIDRVVCKLGSDDRARSFSVITLEADGDDIEAERTNEWQRFADAIDVLLFAELSRSEVVAARVERAGSLIGEPWPVILYPRIPIPSGAHYPFGFPHSKKELAEIPPGFEPRVKNAVVWLLRALRSDDVFEKTFMAWTALEALAPEVKAASICDRCEAPLKCECGEVQETHRVMYAIKEHLKGIANSRELSRMYAARSKLVHGEMHVNADNVKTLMLNSMRLVEICVEAVRRDAGWAASQGPSIRLEGDYKDQFAARCNLTWNTEQARLEPLLVNVRSVMGKPSDLIRAIAPGSQ